MNIKEVVNSDIVDFTGTPSSYFLLLSVSICAKKSQQSKNLQR